MGRVWLRLVFFVVGVVVLFKLDHSYVENTWWFSVIEVVFLILAFGFFYWLFRVRKPPEG